MKRSFYGRSLFVVLSGRAKDNSRNPLTVPVTVGELHVRRAVCQPF